jgi:hypothetical protein
MQIKENIMDEDFEYFLEKLSPQASRLDVPKSSFNKYRGKLPDKLLEYWQERGWGGYANGLFTIVNPEEYEPVLDAWIGETPYMDKDAYHIIARSAFGKLYFWGERSGRTLMIDTVYSLAFPKENFQFLEKKDLELFMQCFFSGQDKESNDFENLFEPAIKKYRSLDYDEMFGFVPALAMGGKPELKFIEPVKAVEHLVMLAQMEPLKEITAASFGG